MTRTLASAFLAFFAVLATASSSHSSSIQQMNYQFSYEGVARQLAPQPVHTACDKCPPVTGLTLAQRQSIPVAVRLSEDIVPAEPPPRIESRETTVHFAKNSHALNDPQKAKLTAFSQTAREILSRGKGAVVTVKGYTCDLGSNRTNDRLARKRAETVGKFMTSQGVLPDSTAGEGKCCYLTQDPSQRHANRRVTVSIAENGGKR
ncbi:MAG TPA: hypothetical protein DDZ40_06280 [Deltaproteobacteria bacterium]|nr:hypothetical protein [Deltaproteobacteria bacterium]